MPFTRDSVTDAVRCERACRFWQLVFSGLTAMTFREKGEEALRQLWVGLLSAHQEKHFLNGLQKLGIDRSEPPAVVAGKYHYLSNVIGGLRMEYIEESPVKVWNRNRGPMWSYPGISMLALPATLRRSANAAWHPNDGRILGSRRLGWVITKTVMEGDPYDEGYFQEYPYDIGADELLRHEVVANTPECDPAAQPKLDPRLWPEERLLKARRRYVGSYVAGVLEILLGFYGEIATCYIVGQTMRCLATQYTGELFTAHEVKESTADAFTDFTSSLLSACGQEHEIVVVGPGHYSIRFHDAPKPFGEWATERLRDAYFQFFPAAAKMVNGHLAVIRTANAHRQGSEFWEIRDAGRWLW